MEQESKDKKLVWEVGIPLITNPFLLRDIVKILGIIAAFFVVLIVIILRNEPLPEILDGLMKGVGIGVGGVLLFFCL